MKMNTTTHGIEWDRVRPEHQDALAGIVDAAADVTGRTVCLAKSWYNQSEAAHANQAHYTTLDGRTMCTGAALKALEDNSKHPGMTDALGTTRKAAFAAHVRSN